MFFVSNKKLLKKNIGRIYLDDIRTLSSNPTHPIIVDLLLIN